MLYGWRQRERLKTGLYHLHVLLSLKGHSSTIVLAAASSMMSQKAGLQLLLIGVGKVALSISCIPTNTMST